MQYFRIMGQEPVKFVIEMGLGACVEEWNILTHCLKDKGGVLVYERAGIGRSKSSDSLRTPDTIAKELHELLGTVNHDTKIILIAHSQGGLYAQQYIRMYPKEVKGLILEKMVNLKLGWLVKKMMKNAPPLYYAEFSKEDADAILNSYTNKEHLKTCYQEYICAHDKKNLQGLINKGDFPNIPLTLIIHSSKFAIEESMQFGNNSREFASRIEDMWQGIMKEYLDFSTMSTFLQAEHSSHYIHLTEPELIVREAERML